MRRQLIARSQTKDHLSDLNRIAILMAPVRLKCFNQAAHGWLIVREQIWSVSVRASAPVRAHSARFKRAHFDAKGRDLLGQRFAESPNGPLGSVVRRAAGNADPT